MSYRYFIQLSYKGTNYHGWQIQPNAKSVQEVITHALSTVLRQKIDLTGAGRTDTGVHASYYMAHFDTLINNLHSNNKIIFKLNSFLPKDISIKNIISVEPEAHARFNAVSRTYQYFIHHYKDPFFDEYSYFIPYELDIELLNSASKILYNYTDFTSFSKLHSDVKTNNCIINNALWTKDGYKLTFTISADRFLRNMVRAIVGTLIDIGRNKITPEDFKQIIENKNRPDAGVSAPAHGLFLTDIKYPKDLFIQDDLID